MSKYTKTRETLGNHKTCLFFWHDMVDPKKVQNWPFCPTHCFYVSPGICRRFWTETQTPKNAVFRPRSYSKGPNHALEKVLTKETPGISRLCIVCGENLERRRWTHLNSTPEGSILKKCLRHKEVETSFSQSQMEQSKSLGKNSV